MSDLHRLLYESTATGSTDNLLNMVTILAESQRNNARIGLTGALVAHRGRYIQVIEGAPHALDALLDRLQDDRRHKDIHVIARAPVESRSFAEWTMASGRVTPSLEPLLDRVVDGADTDPATLVAAIREAASAA